MVLDVCTDTPYNDALYILYFRKSERSFQFKKKNQNINFNRFFYNVEDSKKKKKGKGDFNKNQEYSLLEIFYNKMENIKKNDA